MELRKKIKRPQRYQPDHDKHPWESHISNALPPASATPFVDFNPDLPAAAFPTLEQPSIATRCPALSSETARSTVATEGGRSRIVQREEAGELLQPTDTSRESWLASNGPQNQIFMNNLQLLRRDMGKSEEDWVMQEMETSDEEEQLAMVSSKVSHYNIPVSLLKLLNSWKARRFLEPTIYRVGTIFRK